MTASNRSWRYLMIPLVFAGMLSVSFAAELNPAAVTYKLPDQIPWSPVDARGAQNAVVVGDPSKPGFYMVYTKWTKGNHFSRPHFHPNVEYALATQPLSVNLFLIAPRLESRRRILRAWSCAAVLVTQIWSSAYLRALRVQVDLQMVRRVFPNASLLAEETSFRSRDGQGVTFRDDLPRMAGQDRGGVFVEGEKCSRKKVPAPGEVCSGPHEHNLRRSI